MILEWERGTRRAALLLWIDDEIIIIIYKIRGCLCDVINSISGLNSDLSQVCQIQISILLRGITLCKSHCSSSSLRSRDRNLQMPPKALSSSTLSLRFMRNAEQKHTAPQAQVRDDAEWELPQDARSTLVRDDTVTYEHSYLPFLFDQPRGRRTFDKHGKEVAQVCHLACWLASATYTARYPQLQTNQELRPPSRPPPQAQAKHRAPKRSPRSDHPQQR